MQEPLLHSRTKQQIDVYLKQRPHAALLVGPTGIGKKYLALFMAESLGSQSHIVEKPEDKASILIEQIRSLYNLTKTGRNQVVVIDNAHLMNKEAQNAFLKLLEEPPDHTRFILTTSSSNTLLETIKSRAQTIDVIRPKEPAFLAYFNTDGEDFLQQVRVNDYLPAKVQRALDGAVSGSEESSAMEQAKHFYVSDAYTRHRWLIETKYEKQTLINLLSNLTLIVQSLLQTKSADKKTLKKLIEQAKLIEQTVHNTTGIPGNPKIHLTKLAEML